MTVQSSSSVAHTRTWAFIALGAALVVQVGWTILFLARESGSLADLTRPLLFTGTLGALFLTRGRVAWVVFAARIVIGGAFFDALWGRFDNFAQFVVYTGRVNAFLPVEIIPLVAIVATALECLLCAALLLGVATQWAALGAAALLFLFATAMVASGLGFSQFEWAVYVLSAGAWVVATSDARFASVDQLLSSAGVNRRPRARHAKASVRLDRRPVSGLPDGGKRNR